MNKKILIDLAACLKAERPAEHWDANKRMQWNMDVKAIMKVARKHNERFDANRFETACGGLFEV